MPNPVSAAYFCNWSVYSRKFSPDRLPVNSLTHVLYAFLSVESDGQVSLSDEWADNQLPVAGHAGCIGALRALRQEQQAKGRPLYLLFSVGGAAHAANLVKAFGSDMSRNRFCKSVCDIAVRYGFDGIDIDFEVLKSAAESKNLVMVLHMLRSRLPEAILTVACPAGQDAARYIDVSTIDAVINYWFVMAYDFSGPWSPRAYYHANLYGPLSADSAVNMYVSRGATPEKIVLGCPLYARLFEGARLNGSYTSCPEPVAIRELPSFESYSLEAGAACGHIGSTLVVFDTVNTVQAKANYVKEKGLGGVFWWEASQDAQGTEARIEAVFNTLYS